MSQEIILRWVIVFLKNILKCLLTKSTSDSFFLIILRGHLVFFAYGSPHVFLAYL